MITVSSSLSFRLTHLDADPRGRYLNLDALFDNVQLVIASIYAPNSHQKSFFKMIMTKLSHYPKESIILCGDFNDINDRTLNSFAQWRKSPTALSMLMQNLYDPWQCLHGSERDYTYYTAAKKVLLQD